MFNSRDPEKLKITGPYQFFLVFLKYYKYPTDQKILYHRQFSFPIVYSMECAITNLTNEIHEFLDLEKYCFTLGILIDLSKTFDTVDNKILLKNSSYMI